MDGKDEQSDNSLELQGVIGFNGAINNGLLLHPGDKHIIYPLGTSIVVKHLTENTQTFLQKDGHTSNVSCLALSASGKYLASGSQTHMGFDAYAIVWNLETYEVVHRLKQHKGKVQAMAFSHDERFLATLGGRDDNKLVVWDVESGQPICGASAASDTVLTVSFMHNRSDVLVTGGKHNLRVWDLQIDNRKLVPYDVNTGQMRRNFTSLTFNTVEDAQGNVEDYMYCGTSTGDIFKVLVRAKLFSDYGPKSGKNNVPKFFQQGIACLITLPDGNILVGAGDGTVAIVNPASFKVKRRMQLAGGVTSLALNAAQDHFFVSTAECNVYLVRLEDFEFELRNTCHKGKINDVAFPYGYSELFATCSLNDIRVWHSGTRNELLRIQVPNVECLCICFAPDGKSIISGWSDGKIRAFGPQTGKLLYAIDEVHRDGVTAITCTMDCRRLISGGRTGQVRVWNIGKHSQRMVASMKEHKGQVNALRLNGDDTECISASDDGSCIVWNLITFVRNSCLFASTQFKAAVYHPDGSQVLTTGSDRKLTYWDVTEGNPIRITEGSKENDINCLDCSVEGSRFVAAGGDRVVQVWDYDEGYCYFEGEGHSGEIRQVKISPDQETIVSVGDEGAIFLWTMPPPAMPEE